MSKKNLFLFLLIIGTAFWGISFPLVKTGVGSSVPYVFLAYRFLIASVAMLLIFPSSLRKFNKEIARTALFLAIPLFFGIVLQTYGLKNSPAGQCAFIAGLTVVIVPFGKFGFSSKANSIQYPACSPYCSCGPVYHFR